MKKRTIDALHLSTLTEELTRILHQAGVELPKDIKIIPELNEAEKKANKTAIVTTTPTEPAVNITNLVSKFRY